MIHNVKLELLIKHRNKIFLHFIIKQKHNHKNTMIAYIFSKLCRGCKNIVAKMKCHDLLKIIRFN